MNLIEFSVLIFVACISLAIALAIFAISFFLSLEIIGKINKQDVIDIIKVIQKRD